MSKEMVKRTRKIGADDCTTKRSCAGTLLFNKLVSDLEKKEG